MLLATTAGTRIGKKGEDKGVDSGEMVGTDSIPFLCLCSLRDCFVYGSAGRKRASPKAGARGNYEPCGRDTVWPSFSSRITVVSLSCYNLGSRFVSLVTGCQFVAIRSISVRVIWLIVATRSSVGSNVTVCRLVAFRSCVAASRIDITTQLGFTSLVHILFFTRYTYDTCFVS